jgi:hypothetical protein
MWWGWPARELGPDSKKKRKRKVNLEIDFRVHQGF